MNYTASLAASHKHFKGHDAAGDMSLVAAGQDTTGIYTGEDLLRSIVTVIKPTMSPSKADHAASQSPTGTVGAEFISSTA